MVCSDNFDDNDAKVACRDMGYAYGKSLCCSAFGSHDYQISITGLQCLGNEPTLKDCKAIDGLKRCASKKYASVVCTDKEPSHKGRYQSLIHYFIRITKEGQKITEGHSKSQIYV